jgi:hypothetical protein
MMLEKKEETKRREPRYYEEVKLPSHGTKLYDELVLSIYGNVVL